MNRRPLRSFANPTLISYCAIVFSFALMFAGLFTSCDGFCGASACWLHHIKQ